MGLYEPRRIGRHDRGLEYFEKIAAACGRRFRSSVPRD
jgi:hypothetical protein